MTRSDEKNPATHRVRVVLPFRRLLLDESRSFERREPAVDLGLSHGIGARGRGRKSVEIVIHSAIPMNRDELDDPGDSSTASSFDRLCGGVDLWVCGRLATADDE
jgi:hypothetical protein